MKMTALLIVFFVTCTRQEIGTNFSAHTYFEIAMMLSIRCSGFNTQFLSFNVVNHPQLRYRYIPESVHRVRPVSHSHCSNNNYASSARETPLRHLFPLLHGGVVLRIHGLGR
ncbi:hypothetical protein C8Q75DRAFT_588891 [Abortiporus biennis]|nr:hypothetical protein C8Q75DRAFT_588891 [Abortiporus biennis]